MFVFLNFNIQQIIKKIKHHLKSKYLNTFFIYQYFVFIKKNI